LLEHELLKAMLLGLYPSEKETEAFRMGLLLWVVD
jgi:hypothetical protein